MKHLTTLLAGAALVVTVAIGAEASRASDDRAASPFVTDVDARNFTVSGTVVSTRGDTLVVRIDDHGHRIAFALGSGVDKPKVGTRVTVHYHPSGTTGQVADEIQVRR